MGRLQHIKTDSTGDIYITDDGQPQRMRIVNQELYHNYVNGMLHDMDYEEACRVLERSRIISVEINLYGWELEALREYAHDCGTSVETIIGDIIGAYIVSHNKENKS